MAASGQAVCKTVGLAYVGSNSTPATIKLAGQTRPVGRVSCVAGAACGNRSQCGTSRLQSLFGLSGCCKRREWLAVPGAPLSRVVEQRLSTRARDPVSW